MSTEDQSYHYQVMRRAIDLIDDGAPNQSLSDLAAQLGMSPAHFQRIFSRWVGVSPKRYQQYLTLDHAKSLLRDHMTTLEVSHEVGLSGNSRLHDLFIRWEAMSPGEYARGGEGLTVYWGWYDSPFGLALVMGTEKGLCGLAFAAETGTEPAMEDMLSRWPKATYVEDPMMLRPLVDAAFAQSGQTALHMIGAPFQIKVWEALLKIPMGAVASYGNIARHIGQPSAARAVGTAIANNPVAFLIP
ncbi:MAG: bifunctional helix-turn-helix domain-containing protein/methylated-DNA--[protein]-cysteine S-methyltransferase, partial [Pseudomonadota bacterium]|nr:bifunctional helix-turn-helix domain-containing protein/methylated-DNA--[protein]-cysteine S-methyltransferase [Pseudomonadota bacterium]